MEPLIYIEQKEKDEATLLLKGLTNPNLRKRVYVNGLGAELLMKYLVQEGISVANVYNMHNIFKVREEFDIADVMLPNIHIDVRVVYDKDVIFVPKSHFEYNLVPDVYVIFNMAQDSTHVDFLGFIKPENIDKSKQNSEYYFVDKEQLVHPFEFIEFVRNFEGNTTEDFSESLYSDAISLIDNDINSAKKQELIDALRKSAALREELIEFDNFEWLSYNASKEDIIDAVKEEPSVIDEFDMFEEKDDFGFDDNQETQDVVEDSLPADIETAEIPTDVLSGAEEVLETAEAADEISDIADVITDSPEEISGDIESLEMPDDLSIDFDGEVSLDAEETTQEPELEAYGEINDSESTTEVEDVVTEIDDTSVEEQNAPEVESYDELSEENIELADISEPMETLEPEQDRIEFEAEEGGFGEELENLTSIADAPQDSVEEINVPESIENNEGLVDLVSLDNVETISEEISNYSEESAQEELEDLVSLEELSSGLDDPDGETSSEALEAGEELMELEAYNNPASEEPEQVEIVEEPAPETETPATESFENSTVISSSDQTPGEIAIDINAPEKEDLGVLYDENTAEIENEAVTKSPEKGKKAIVVAAAAAVVLAASATYFVMNNNKQTDVVDNPVVEEPEPQVGEEEEQPVPEEETVVTVTEKPAKKVAETKQAPPTPKPIEASAYLSIKKMGWSVPDYVSYNDGFKRYLQTLGKSIRLALDSDLLLATEYPYSDVIFVDIKLSETGSVSKVTISKSSGSKQIDDIVLRTVKETANVVKAPAGVVVGDKFQMTLKISL